MKQQDTLQLYLSLHNALQNEKRALEHRLAQIKRVLGEGAEHHQRTALSTSKTNFARRQARQPAKRTKNPISVKEVIRKVTANRPLTKKEILEEIQKIGYKLNTKDPMNYLGSVLYARANNFRNQEGRFSPGPAKEVRKKSVH